MLAIKLHTIKKPPLARGSHLIPIRDWQTGKIVIRHWISALNQGGGKVTTKVRYITLVKIPDTHPVCLALSASTKTFAHLQFAPLSQMLGAQKDQYFKWYERFAMSVASVESQNLPELVLGEPLTKKHIKWTKRVQLLYGRESNIKTRKRSES